MYRGGMNYMRHSVSDTAEYGDYIAGDRIITDETRKAMQKLLDEVKDGTFAKNWIAENKNGRPWFSKRRAAESDLQIETVGKEMRRMMPFLDAKEVLPGLRGAQAGAGAGAPSSKKSEKEVPVAGAAR
jgi:ketol-acid reductoisomerase